MGSGNLVTKKVVRRPSSIDQDIKFDQSWVEDVACPICLDSPHNAVLLRCASYEKGCRPFICDTDQTRSNCLERFRGAHGLPLPVPANARASSRTVAPLNSIHTITISSSNANNNRPACPLCRGDVMGWFVIGEARSHLNQKRRCCEESRCSYVGSFHELQRHTQQKHPDSRPSAIDPARRADWENLQRSSDVVDVLSTIHAQVPNGVVLGDYVIEYGDGDEAGDDDYEVYHGVRASWWTSCIFCKAFCRSSPPGGVRRRTRTGERRSSGGSGTRSSSNRSSSSQERFTLDEVDDGYVVAGAMARAAVSGTMDARYRDPTLGHRRSHS
ncbi:uncharacterized protein [Zea mays]|uniref:Uncharacterized protein n=1 Tax=Zea mays TaxID=4577 RepID=A0A804P4H1_MAIZE|nr:uncharacterized protein LOC100275497 isoform X1 [Zea mays]|eukprot:XP_008676914.1 uncharacterized protein LOC100275497 isoform X1 [Zea mays]